jgi:[ribosomal protein S5]-alanine N-acetyltransferase
MKLLTIPTIETEHYFLRGLTINDAHEILDFLSDQDTMKFITANPLQTREEVENSIRESLFNFKQEKEIPWVVVSKFEEKLIGTFRFHKLHLWHKKTEMGVVIRKEFQKKGVMTEVLPSILEFGFNKLELNRIVGDIFAHNTGSEKLLLKFGFHKDGQLRQTDFDGERYHDTVVYSLLSSEYRAKGKKR